MPRRKNGTDPTPKEKRLVATYIKKNFNGAQAALEVYDTTKKNAGNLAAQVLNKPAVKEELKRQLDAAGLSIDNINEFAFQAVSKNINDGKPSQAAGVSMLQFLYKLHNAVPGNKSSTTKLSLSASLSPQQVAELIPQLKNMSTKSNELIEDIS